MLCVRSTYLCSGVDPTRTLQGCSRIVRCVQFQELTYTTEKPVLLYFTRQYKDKQIFSVCWTLEVTEGDGICDCIRYVDHIRAPPPLPKPYVY